MTRMLLLAALALACVLSLPPAFAMAYPPDYEGGATGLAFGLTFIGLAFVAAGALFLLWVAPRRPIPLALAAIVGVLWFGTAFAAADDPVTWGGLGATIGFAGLGFGAILLIGFVLAVIGGIIISAWSH